MFGTFDTVEEAIKARLKGERDMLGDFPSARGRPRPITMNGMTKNISHWSTYFGIRRETFEQRLADGWPFEWMSEPVTKRSGRPNKKK